MVGIRKTDLEIQEIRETYKKVGSIVKTASILNISKLTVNKYVKDLSVRDKHSRNCKIQRAVIKLSLEGEELAEYKNANTAAKENNISSSNLIQCLSGRIKTCQGHFWCYKDEIENFKKTIAK